MKVFDPLSSNSRNRIFSFSIQFILIFSLIFGPLNLVVEAAPSTLHLQYLDVQKKAAQHSSLLAAAHSERRAAESKKQAQFTRFLPTLSFDASGRWLSEVPELELMPGNSVAFGDNLNYSLGIGAYWTLWDSLGNYHGWKSAQAAETQKEAETQLAELDNEREASLAYFQFLLSSTRLQSVSEALELSRFQHQDIQQRVRSGAASQLDTLSSQREVLELESQLLLAKSELVRTLQSLLSLTGDLDRYDLGEPIVNPRNSLTQDSATLVIRTEPVSRLRELFNEKTLLDHPPTSQHPRIAVGQNQSKALEHAARGISAQQGPIIRVQARTSYDYPNGPVLDPVHQNMIGATLTWSLFESGRVLRETAEKRSLAEAVDHRTEQVRRNLIREWNDSRIQLLSLKKQQTVSAEAAQESQKIAELTFQSYRHGRMSFLDVQNANVRALHATLRAAQLEIQVLIELSKLKNLTGGSSSES